MGTCELNPHDEPKNKSKNIETWKDIKTSIGNSKVTSNNTVLKSRLKY